jgi:hypothetical protein
VSRWDAAQTASERGLAWDYEVARRVRGRRQVGSGNRPYAKLDAAVGGELLVSGKHTDAESLRLTPGMVDEATRAVCGPEAITGAASFVAVHFGLELDGPALAVVDLDLYLTQLSAPPEIIQPTRDESLRASVRVPPSLRGL